MIPAMTLPERFFIDCAIGVRPFDEICLIHSLDPQDLDPEDSEFKRRLKQASQAVEDEGAAFRARCRLIVNDSIPIVERILQNVETPPSVRMDAFKTLAKYGELEPSKDKEAGYSGPHLSLTIIAPNGERMVNELNPIPALAHDDA